MGEREQYAWVIGYWEETGLAIFCALKTVRGHRLCCRHGEMADRGVAIIGVEDVQAGQR